MMPGAHQTWPIIVTRPQQSAASRAFERNPKNPNPRCEEPDLGMENAGGGRGPRGGQGGDGGARGGGGAPVGAARAGVVAPVGGARARGGAPVGGARGEVDVPVGGPRGGAAAPDGGARGARRTRVAPLEPNPNHLPAVEPDEDAKILKKLQKHGGVNGGVNAKELCKYTVPNYLRNHKEEVNTMHDRLNDVLNEIARKRRLILKLLLDNGGRRTPAAVAELKAADNLVVKVKDINDAIKNAGGLTRDIPQVMSADPKITA